MAPATRAERRTIRTKRQRRRRALSAVLVWCAIGALLCLGLSSILGGPVRLVVVRGSSMEPTYMPGDLIVVESVSEPKVGDVLAYPIAGGDDGGHVIHRAIRGDADSGFVTRGDNRESDDPWTPTADELDGRAVMHFPGLGRYFVGWLVPLALAAAASIALTWALWIAPEPALAPEAATVDDITPARAARDAA